MPCRRLDGIEEETRDDSIRHAARQRMPRRKRRRGVGRLASPSSSRSHVESRYPAISHLSKLGFYRVTPQNYSWDGGGQGWSVEGYLL